MNATTIAPLYTTRCVDATRDFYTSVLGFEVTMDMPEYLGLKLPGSEVELGFCVAGAGDGAHIASEPKGLMFCFHVDDVAAEYAALRAKGAELDGPPEDMPWGERRVLLSDPNGVTLYVGQRVSSPEVAGA